MRDNSKAVEPKVERINTLLKDVITMLVEDPHCLDGNPWRHQVHQLAIAHLEAKMEQSKHMGQVSLNSACVVRLEILLSNFYEAADENSKLVAAGKVADYAFGASAEELKLIPDQLKEDVFTVAIIYLAKCIS